MVTTNRCFNTYQGFSSLWVQGSDEPVFSWEGVTQGDPLVTFLYALGVLSLLSDREVVGYYLGMLMTLPVWLLYLNLPYDCIPTGSMYVYIIYIYSCVT